MLLDQLDATMAIIDTSSFLWRTKRKRRMSDTIPTRGSSAAMLATFILFLAISLQASLLAQADFVRLIKKCYTDKGRGTCVKDAYCCKAVGGEVLQTVCNNQTRTTTTVRPYTSPPTSVYGQQSSSNNGGNKPYQSKSISININNDIDNSLSRRTNVVDDNSVFAPVDAHAMYGAGGATPYKVPYRYYARRESRAAELGTSTAAKKSSRRHVAQGRAGDESESAADELEARTVGSTPQCAGHCPYEQVCCVVQEQAVSQGCDVCGVKGNGDLSLMTMPPVMPSTPAPYTTSRPSTRRPSTKYLKERMMDDDENEQQQHRSEMLAPRSLEKRSLPTDKNWEARILGGADAARNEYCWQVALMNVSGLFGSGVLITNRHVLTTAHTIRGRFFDSFIAVFGEYNFIHLPNDNSVWYSQPLNVWLHPDYNSATFENDIAIIEVPEVPCQYSSICTVCLPDQAVSFPSLSTTVSTTTTTTTTTTTRRPTSSNSSPYGSYANSYPDLTFDPWEEMRKSGLLKPDPASSTQAPDTEANDQDLNPYVNMPCSMTGWGATRQTELAERLQALPTRIIGNKRCDASLKEAGVDGFNLPSTMFCGEGATDGTGSCDRDGGGPLVCQVNGGTWSLVGLIALGTDACRTDAGTAPTLFVNVGLYKGWIQTIIMQELPTPGASSLPSSSSSSSTSYRSNFFINGADRGGGGGLGTHQNEKFSYYDFYNNKVPYPRVISPEENRVEVTIMEPKLNRSAAKHMADNQLRGRMVEAMREDAENKRFGRSL